MINLHTVEFILNFIEYECDAIISNITWTLWTTLFFVSFLSTYRKLSYGSVYRSCCCIGILISSLYPNVVCGERAVRVSLNLDDAIGSFLMFRISSQMLRTANPKDFKNVMFDTLSYFFFFCLIQLVERVLLNCDVTGFVKNALSLCVHSVPFSISCSHYHCRMCNLTVISSLENRALVWRRIVRFVMLRAMIGR